MIYADFLNYVMPAVPGCPTNLALQEIRNSMIELCEKSLIIQRDHPPVTLLEEITDYDFEPPEGYLVVKIMKMWYLGDEISPATLDNRVWNGYAYNNLVVTHTPRTKGPPRTYTQKDEYGFSIWPMPDEAKVDGLTLRVALKPTRICPDDCDPVDDRIFEDYAETVAAGAKRRLMLLPAKPYSNPQQALVEQQIFTDGLNTARHRAVRGYVRSSLSVRNQRM